MLKRIVLKFKVKQVEETINEKVSFLSRKSIEESNQKQKMLINSNTQKMKTLVGFGLMPLIPAPRMMGQEY